MEGEEAVTGAQGEGEAADLEAVGLEESLPGEDIVAQPESATNDPKGL